MREMNLMAKGARKHYVNYTKKAATGNSPNLLEQQFVTTKKNKVWVGDITYIPTKEGILYLSTFIDLFTRKVVGWSMSARIKESIAIDAFLQAYGREQPQSGLVIHTDQGSQYTSYNFRAVIEDHECILSNSRRGNPYDNAVMESFFKTIKRELINDSKYLNREQAQQDIFKYIEMYYNTERIHSSLDYMTPIEYEKHTDN